MKRFPSLTTQILIALVLGIFLGWAWPRLGRGSQILADIFLRLVLMLIGPLVFSTLVVGIAGTSFHQTGRMVLKAFVYFFALTALAMALGLATGLVVAPGAGLEFKQLAAEPSSLPSPAKSPEPLWVRMFPTSLADALARGDILQLVIFSVLFGAALAASGEKGKPVLNFCSALAEAMYKLTNYVMALAPLGVLGATAAMVASRGLASLVEFGRLIFGYYAALALFVFVLLFAIARLAGLSFARFLRAVREPFLIAFSTTSSAAALPKAMEAMEGFGVPRHVVAFVLPTGYGFNLQGASVYLGLAALFVAQGSGVPMGASELLSLFAVLFLTSKGIATVPRGSVIALIAGLTSYGLPLEGAVVLLAIDQVLDMPRTGVNVVGNCLATAVVARWEGVSIPRE